jgi:hypothetical protein
MHPLEFLLRPQEDLTTHWDSLAASIVNQKAFDDVTIWCTTKQVLRTSIILLANRQTCSAFQFKLLLSKYLWPRLSRVRFGRDAESSGTDQYGILDLRIDVCDRDEIDLEDLSSGVQYRP